MRTLIRSLTALCSGLLAAACVSAQSAAGFPSKPIRIIVPTPAGVPADVISRIIGQKLSVALNQPVVVENKVGASGNIGTAYVAAAAPDGYTLVAVGSNFATNPSLFSKPGYDPQKDFTAITGLIRTPSVLIVPAESAIKSVEDLIARAKADPKAFSYASGGNGTLAHLSSELFKAGAGIEALHVPYKSSVEILNSMLTKTTDFAFPVLASAMTQIKAGKFRALAVTSERRMPQLPDVPTMLEAMGKVGFVLDSENSLLVPAGTPAPIVAMLNAEIVKILRDPALAEQMISQGYEMAGNSPDEANARIARDVPKFADAVRKSGAKLD